MINLVYFQIDLTQRYGFALSRKSCFFNKSIQKIELHIRDKNFEKLVSEIVQEVNFLFAVQSVKMSEFFLHGSNEIFVELFVLENLLDLFHVLLFHGLYIRRSAELIVFQLVELKFSLLKTKLQIVNFLLQKSIFLL